MRSSRYPVIPFPTCTAVDKAAGLALAQIAGLDVEKYAIDMFSAGSNLKGKSDGDIFYQDFKRFTSGKVTIGGWTDYFLKWWGTG